MITKELLDNSIQALDPSTTVESALKRMKEEEYNALPITGEQGKKLLGFVHKEALEKKTPAESGKQLNELEWEEIPGVTERQHLFEAARLMYHYNVMLLPVLDDNEQVKGYIIKRYLQAAINGMLNLGEYGSVITVEMMEKDYSLSQIVQLIETEGGKILGLTVETPGDQTNYFRVSIKLNIKDVTRVVAALRRYDYLVTSETWSEVLESDMQDRVGELLHFLDM